ncbi:uncharacterized protein J8A68_005658 [[Candida] subhashii]|uniref:GP-PDE domain-containing protein n=1 Tax=[Candida] subhashii TaxID=561895 RepID=A0A8J5UJ58_9ASCO|nr:uncharacterized protein J8A68_005658 [[Candida] subhashii]KAG7660841.1 hypothetical protein J8A68_005658 [[Candida] subhashii]
MSTISPVIVGHRGFKGQHPENTLVGFKAAYDVGATVLETDLWLTKDNRIVISHDGNTKRVFVDQDGNETDYTITETDFDTLKELRTLDGGYPLLSFQDVLHFYKDYVDNNEKEQVLKLQLDIKRFNPAKITKYIIEDLLIIEDDLNWWINRIQFGIWDLNFLKYLNQDDFFQQKFKAVDNGSMFDIFHISTNWRDSIFYINYNYYLDGVTDNDRIKFKLSGVSLIYLASWSVGFLTKFVPLLKAQDLKLYSWTINHRLQYDYLTKVGKIAELSEYGVISDFPDLMLSFKHQDQLPKEEEVEETTPLVGSITDLLSDLTFKQRLSYHIFSQFNYWAGDKRLTEEEKQYELPVDENKIRHIQINSYAVWLFHICQKFGIF